MKCMQEEWRVHMLPIEFLFLTVLPVIDMSLVCKSSGTGYPAGVPKDASKVLELNIVSNMHNLMHSLTYDNFLSSFCKTTRKQLSFRLNGSFKGWMRC